MPHKNRVPGNTLILTIVIALILAILSSAVIMLGYYSRQHQISANIEQRLSRNLESAMNLVLEEKDGRVGFYPAIDTIDLFDKQEDSVIIKKESWGIFEIACITAYSNRFVKKQGFINGAGLPGYMDGCLYVADHKRPLSVNGNTTLTGDVYLSKGGIKPIYINQRGYGGNKLVDGNIKTSNESLPPLNEAIINYLYKLERDSIPFSGVETQDSLTQSFFDSVVYIHAKDSWRSNGRTLKGHIMIRADSLIEVDADTRAEDVIFIAPVVRFKKGFKGIVQAIATDSLIVESDCSFNYPSALVLLKLPGLKMQNVLRIEEDCTFNGIIVARCANEDLTKTRVDIKPRSRIDGVAYVMGYCSLAGNVNGTVLCDYFLYQQQSILYENCLVDVSLNRRTLSPYFIGSPVFNKPAAKQIVKWIK